MSDINATVKSGIKTSEFWDVCSDINVPESNYPPAFKTTKEDEYNFWQEVIERERKAGITEPWIDPNMRKLFKGQMLNFGGACHPSIFRFKHSFSHRSIREEARREEYYFAFLYSSALNFIRLAILAGEVDDKMSGIMVYFTENDVQYCLWAWRNLDARLRIRVDELNEGSETFDEKIECEGCKTCFL